MLARGAAATPVAGAASQWVRQMIGATSPQMVDTMPGTQSNVGAVCVDSVATPGVCTPDTADAAGVAPAA